MAWPRWSSELGIVLALLAMLLSAPASAQRGVGLVSKESATSGQATPYINGTYRALVIGNDRYKDPEGLWKPLKTAVNDARAVADVLQNHYGFGDVRLLLDATRRQMNKAFNQIAEDSRRNDSVLIYYAGHGVLRESTGEGYWIPVDAEGRDDGTFYPNSIIKTKVGVIADKAKHVLLVSDSCFSGALLREGNRGIRIDQRNEGYFRKVAAKKSVQILAAGGLEFVDDNYKGTGHSPFTYFFLEELKTNTGGLLDATELSSAVVRNVANNVQQSPEKGVLHGAGHAGGEFFFVKASVGSSAPVAADVPKGPGKSGFSLSDITGAAQKQQASRRAWAAKLEEMKNAAGQVRALEGQQITPDLKGSAWKRLLAAFAEDNPYTIEDDDLRSNAQGRIAHWQSEQQRVAGLERDRKRKAEAQRKQEAERKRQQAAIRIKPLSNTWRDPVTGMEFVQVPGGSFQMGCVTGDTECDGDEKPVRTVRLDGFWLGKHEVTQGQWKKVTGNNPSAFKKGDNYPVEQVSWDDAQKFIRKLNAQSSATFSLPSEAQWEFACRAGGETVTYGTRSGRLDSGSAKYSSGDGTVAVGTYSPNAMGLHDMSGNVWEWVQDKKTGYGNVGTDNPIYERSGAFRVFRGGSWSSSPRYLRCSFRGYNTPSFRYYYLGFRLLRVP